VDVAAADAERQPAAQGAGDLVAGALDDPAEGRAGYVHPLRGLILVEPLEVGEPERLELVECQPYQLKSACPYPGGLEDRDVRSAGDAAAVLWSGHA